MAIYENLCRCGHHWWSNNPYDECPKCKTGATEAGGVDIYKRAERSRQACQVLQKPNAAYDEIQRLQSELTAAKAEIERLRGRCAELEGHADRMLAAIQADDFALDAEAQVEADRLLFDSTEDYLIFKEDNAQRLRTQAEAAEKGGDDG